MTDTSAPWRLIETAPRDGQFVLLHVPKGLESGEVTVGAYWKAEERQANGRFMKGTWDGWLGMDSDTMSSWCEPTHWMPLPEPPVKEDLQSAGLLHPAPATSRICQPTEFVNEQSAT